MAKKLNQSKEAAVGIRRFAAMQRNAHQIYRAGRGRWEKGKGGISRKFVLEAMRAGGEVERGFFAAMDELVGASPEMSFLPDFWERAADAVAAGRKTP